MMVSRAHSQANHVANTGQPYAPSGGPRLSQDFFPFFLVCHLAIYHGGEHIFVSLEATVLFFSSKESPHPQLCSASPHGPRDGPQKPKMAGEPLGGNGTRHPSPFPPSHPTIPAAPMMVVPAAPMIVSRACSQANHVANTGQPYAPSGGPRSSQDVFFFLSWVSHC